MLPQRQNTFGRTGLLLRRLSRALTGSPAGRRRTDATAARSFGLILPRLGLLAVLLTGCALPDPPRSGTPQPSTLPLLAVSPAPTLDAAATETLLAQPATTPPAMPTATPAAIVTPDGPPRYTVQPGDTLATIARQFETTVEAIIALNQLADPNQIEVGQQLVLPAPGGTAAPADGP